MQDKDLDARNGDYTRGILCHIGTGVARKASSVFCAVQAR